MSLQNMLHIQNRTSNTSCPELQSQGYKASFQAHSAARGPRKKIYHGHLDGKGPRKGEEAVVKVFRDKAGTEQLCDLEIEKHKLARKLANRFNDRLPDERSKVTFTLPMKSRVESLGMASHFSRHKGRSMDKQEWVLVEENLVRKGEYQVFVRKTGERLTNDPTSLDAFLHFSYHESQGSFVMCGFQGIHTRHGYILTTPCFHSTDRTFGWVVDKGHDGIRDVFKHHLCNNHCYNMVRPPHGINIEGEDSQGNEESPEGELIQDGADENVNTKSDFYDKLISRTKKIIMTGHVDEDDDNDDNNSDEKIMLNGKEKAKSFDLEVVNIHHRSNVCAIGTVPRKRPSF